jgi:hypothetical protein
VRSTLEREGKIPANVAARIRKKPMNLIGWGSVGVGIAFFSRAFSHGRRAATDYI